MTGLFHAGRACPAGSRTSLGLIQMLPIAQAFWNPIRGAKKWLAVTLGLFLLAATAGVVVGITNPSVNARVLEAALQVLKPGFQLSFPSSSTT